MQTQVTITEYDNTTEYLIRDVVEIPHKHLTVVKFIAGVDEDDPHVAYVYPLTTDQLLEICNLIDYTIDINPNSSYYLEGHCMLEAM